MSAQIVSLSGAVIPVEQPEPNQTLVQELERLLEAARAGQIVGMAGTYQHQDRAITYSYAGMIGGFAMLGTGLPEAAIGGARGSPRIATSTGDANGKIFPECRKRCEASDAQAQEGHAQKRQGWQRRQGEKPQAGDCHRAFGSPKEGQESAFEKKVFEQAQVERRAEVQ